ncbi:MAG: hypothetical protein PWQ89_84 [Verrucomicrobiota bacterium]|jgi:ferredoxin-NADP reductase|nr:hypothetical protein [Verrucomicrobiota bacterium]
MFELAVRNVRFFTPEIYELSLERGEYVFTPGQCAVLFTSTGDSRPYSLASGPEEPVLRFLIRRARKGSVSTWLATRRPGDVVRVSLPFGDFRPGGKGPASVFVATGVGIAPFLSVLRSSRDAQSAVLCLYGVRYHRDAVELSLLRQHTTLQLAVSREPAEGETHQGRLTGLLETVTLPDDADFFLCGYDAMTDEAFDLLRARGVPAERIHTEVFFSVQTLRNGFNPRSPVRQSGSG